MTGESPTSPAPVAASWPHALWSRKWWIIAPVALIAVAVWQGPRLVLGPRIAVDPVKRGDLIETVVATGSVQTPFRVVISSQITGTVAEVEVAEGQRVTAGQKLVTLEARELEADVVQAQGIVAQAEAHMRQLGELTLPTARANRQQAQATLLNAQQTLDRATTLVRSGDETRVVLDAAQKDFDVARTALRAAELAVYTSSPGGSDYVTGQTQLAQAIASRTTAISRLGYATITAPRAGVLITRSVERGTVAQAGVALLGLAPDGQTQLLLAIDERNLAKLALAQTATASADAYPDKRFEAKISYINPAVDITRASVEVKLDVAKPPDYLRQDMTVSVDIDVAHSDKALNLPARSVHDVLSPAPWVLAIRAGHAVKVPVQLGIQGTSQIEIRDGLAEGDVAIPATSDVTAGQRVRALLP